MTLKGSVDKQTASGSRGNERAYFPPCWPCAGSVGHGSLGECSARLGDPHEALVLLCWQINRKYS